jgi:hypothetical protein
MKLNGRVEVGFHLFLNLALNGGGWSAAMFGRYASGKEKDLVAFEKVIILLLLIVASPFRETRNEAYCLLEHEAVCFGTYIVLPLSSGERTRRRLGTGVIRKTIYLKPV